MFSSSSTCRRPWQVLTVKSVLLDLLQPCLADGYEFFESANKVILCPGNALGYLPTEYFQKVVHKVKGMDPFW